MKYLIAILFTACAFAQTGSWPTAATDQDLIVAKTGATSTLSTGINASTLTVVVADGSKFAQYSIIRIDDEFMQICSIATNTLTLCTGTRGLVGSAASHLAGATVRDVVSEYHHNRLRVEVKAMQAKLLPATSGTSAPVTCAANRELFVDRDASPAPTLSICDAAGTGWTVIAGGSFSDPMTTRGDLIYRSSGGTTRLAIGTNGQCVKSDGTDVSWGACSTFTDPLTTRGDMMYRGAGGTTRLAVGTNGYCLTSNGTDPAWAACPGTAYTAGASGGITIVSTVIDIDTAIVPRKGDTNAWTGANTFSGATKTAPFRIGSADPGTCDETVREFFYNTTTDLLKVCNAADNWTAFSPGSGLADPMTTRGDMIYRSASGTTRLALGTNGQCITSDGTDAVWGSCGSGSGNVTAAGTLTADAPVIGAGTTAVAVGTRSGNTTEFVTQSGAKTAGKQVTYDASGNVIASAYDVGAAGGDASGMTLLHSTVNDSVTGTDAAQTLATYTITSGTLTAGDTVKMEAFVRRTAGAGTDANLMAAMGDGGTPVYGTTISTDGHYIAQWHVTGSTSVTATGMVMRSGATPASMPLDAGDHYTVPTNFDVSSNNVIALKTSGSHIDTDTTYAIVFFRVWRIRQP